MIIYTIGTVGKNAETFFTALNHARVERVVDVRLYNQSLTNGFTAKRDLPYYLSIHKIRYYHCLDLAPTRELLAQYRLTQDWSQYAYDFIELLIKRRIKDKYDTFFFNNSVLLCSEPTADFCHRRLVAEFVNVNMNSRPPLPFEILHL